MNDHMRTRPGIGPFCGPSAAENQDELEVFEQDLLRLVWLEQKRLAQTLAAHGLTVPQFLVLASIWQRQQGCYMGELAGEMLQSSATMTGIVDRLVRMELVYRQTIPNDRRVVLVDLTERGRTLLIGVHEEKRAWLRQTVAVLPEADRRQLMRLVHVYLEISI